MCVGLYSASLSRFTLLALNNEIAIVPSDDCLRIADTGFPVLTSLCKSNVNGAPSFNAFNSGLSRNAIVSFISL